MCLSATLVEFVCSMHSWSCYRQIVIVEIPLQSHSYVFWVALANVMHPCSHQWCVYVLGMFRVLEAPTTTLCVGFSTPRCFLAQAEWSEAYLHQFVGAWMRILLIFFIRYVSWVVASIMSKSSNCFHKCDRNT